ncbi:hypothetical protein EDC04DRAFT_2605129 [Pisolithus marmoratus]|nr:hypothetical protein EDC04DRAFT_2605129 [Pisolithus marmoratus]
MDVPAATHSEYWVVIGGDEPSIYATCPTLRCGRSSPPLPVAIQCLSSTKAKMIYDCLQPILKQALQSPHMSELLTILGQSDVVCNLLSDQSGEFYAVMVGQPMGIHCTRALALRSLCGFLFPCWRELPMLWDALAFMIIKGMDEHLLAVHDYNGEVSAVLAMLPVTSSTSEDSLVKGFDELILDAPHYQGAQGVTCCPIIYTHMCNLHGVIESQFYLSDWASPPQASAEVIGIHAVKYLEAHSYVESATAIIVETYCTSHTDHEFALELAWAGLPLAEGFFMWYLLNL